jgi:hypothetical protein
VAATYKITTVGMVRKWIKDRDSIFAKFHKDTAGSKAKSQRGRFAGAETIVHAKIMAEREVGRKVGSQWIRRSMRIEVTPPHSPLLPALPVTA